MKRQTSLEVALFVLLIAAGAGCRICFRDIPNFAPIAAIALFAGYCFRSRLAAAAVPLLAMAASDAVIGGYEWQMMIVVYALLALPVAWRGLARRWLRVDDRSAAGALSAVTGLIGCSLASSVLFFLGTNFAWWPWSDMYGHDLPGLWQCYQAGLPFFRYTLAGDLFFACALFGGYALATQLGWLAASAPAAEAK